MKTQQKESFVARAIAFVRSEYPGIAKRADEEQLRELVYYAAQRATFYGFVSEREIIRYLAVMVTLGARFDEDEQFRHLCLPLSGMNNTSSTVRIEFLIAMTSETLSNSHAGR